MKFFICVQQPNTLSTIHDEENKRSTKCRAARGPAQKGGAARLVMRITQ